ncbi:MAG TPA: hypothetical protein VKS01_02295 [Bryobacteraceae bacterium]|nr:hypothetical protein [Bryobacteraceae bacterium]
MSSRFYVWLAALAALIAAPVFAQTSGAAKHAAKPAAAKSKSAIPRTPEGHPDFEGIWTNATITPLTRPTQFKDKATITEAEAKTFEQHDATELAAQDGASDGPLIAAAGSSGTGGYNALFVDRGTQLEKVDGQIRTSLIVDPPDGKMPATTEAARKRMSALYRNFNNYDSVHSRPASERCLIGFGSTSGPPMMPVLYNNTYEIVQTPDRIMILVEMVHDVRVIRMNAEHEPASIEKWLGDSIGHWDGDTLVVETTNIRADNRFRGGSDRMKVIERFQRMDTGTILYRATIDDPGTYERPWTVEFPFVATPGPVYEYACHEGNYAMDDILGGARKMEGSSSPATKR